jgi:hypothetical protein
MRYPMLPDECEQLGRERNVRLYGPQGFIAQVEHHLGGYAWNLVGNYTGELAFEVTEILDSTTARRARFACRNGFRREAGVKRITPFHFSPKYEARPEAPEAELYAAFLGAAEG